MKKILVPTDFSDCAEFALAAAVKLADQVGAEIHLLHKVKLDPKYNELNDKERFDYPESYLKIKAMKKKFIQLRELMKHRESASKRL